MQHYVLVFRATRPLAPEEAQQRAANITAWVKQVTEMGITLDPRNLGEVVANLSVKDGAIVSSEQSNDPALATMVYFDSASRELAVDIAQIHPGLRYGVTVELREWASPRATPDKP